MQNRTKASPVAIFLRGALKGEVEPPMNPQSAVQNRHVKRSRSWISQPLMMRRAKSSTAKYTEAEGTPAACCTCKALPALALDNARDIVHAQDGAITLVPLPPTIRLSGNEHFVID